MMFEVFGGLVSTFKGFQIITRKNGGSYCTVKKGSNYEVTLKVYKTEQNAMEGHEKVSNFYSKQFTSKPNSTVREILESKCNL